MRIALFVTATGNYIEFLPKLFTTAQKYFMSNDELTFVLFTDADNLVFDKIKIPIIIKKIEKTSFPQASMNRCIHYMEFMRAEQRDFDYCYAIDADAYFAGHVSKSVIHDLVCVRHCAYINQRGTFEENKKSACYVATDYTGPYLGGGFYGGSSFWFYYMNKQMAEMILTDKANNIIPIWHDESVLNKFFVNCEHPRTILSPAYHYPEWSEGIINPWVKNLWDKEKDYFNNTIGEQLPIDPKIVFVEKGNSNKGAEYYRE